jgi:hypothetical protein
MTVIWFSDEDRERMRRDRAATLEHDRLFWEFVREVQPYGVADRDAKAIPRIEALHLRPRSRP